MQFAEDVFHDPADVHAKLSDLGLTLEILQRAVGEGTLSMLQVTPNHPVTAAGTMLYFEAVRSLRDQAIPLGEDWELLNDQNRALVVNRRRSIVIGVAGGDYQTGMPEGNPSTKARKGDTMKKAVVTNQMCFEEFGDFFARPIPKEIKRIGALWLLLIYVDRASGQARSELSRPISWGSERSRPVAFRPRIILPPIDVGPNSFSAKKTSPPTPTQTPEVVVEIKRRA
jgi:hypothetical protein